MAVLTVRAFGPLMRQRVSIARLASYDAQGEASYGAAKTYQAAVVGETRMVTTEHGQQVPSQQAVYLMSNDPVRPEDKITLSTGDVGSTESWALNPDILAVDRYPFVNGQFVTVVRLSSKGA